MSLGSPTYSIPVDDGTQAEGITGAVTLTARSRPFAAPGLVPRPASVRSRRRVLGEGTAPELSLAIGERSLCKVFKH